MNKIILSVLLILGTFGPLQADFCMSLEGTTIEARVAGLFPSGGLFREIYGDCIDCYEIEASTPIYGCFDAWANIDWMSQLGGQTRDTRFTRISIVNLSFGLKYPYMLSDNLIAYVGIGPSFGIIRVHNELSNSHRNAMRVAVGGVFKTGLQYYANEHLFFDLFFDYLYQPSQFNTHADVGGSKLGLGVGYRF